MDKVSLMRRALALAKRGLATVSPNPAVGAVVVKGGRVVSTGYHKRAGEKHAEVIALERAGDLARGATLYLTLEPCCHHGRTPPCVDRVAASGVKKVVLGASDPNPRVSGRGIEALRKAGIEVEEGVLAAECTRVNEAFNKYITTGRPFVTLKLASTLDGRIATSTGESRWITGPKARDLVHRMRASTDVVLVGGATAMKDDPELTVRRARGANPARAVVDPALRLPLELRLFERSETERVMVFTTSQAGKAAVREARERGIEVVEVGKAPEGADLDMVMKELGKRELARALVEGGGRLSAALLKRKLVDKVSYFVSPRFIGSDGVASVGELQVRSLSQAVSLQRVSSRKVGSDILVEGYPG